MFYSSDMLLRFETRALQRRLVSKIEAKCHFLPPPPVKIKGVIGDMFECHFVATPVGSNHLYTGAPLHRLRAMTVNVKIVQR